VCITKDQSLPDGLLGLYIYRLELPAHTAHHTLHSKIFVYLIYFTVPVLLSTGSPMREKNEERELERRKKVKK
jgi:hypothetical protein